MKKKYFVIISILVILIILWVVIFSVDYSRCNSLKMPIFVVPTKTADDGGSGTYYGLGYKVEVKKYLSAEYGVQIESVEMHFLNRVVAASIADMAEQNEEYNSFVATVLEETTTYMIVEPNENEDERKSADKITINYGEDHIDYLYGVGSKVIIKYTGYIMETYPAQINTNDIEVIK